MNTANCPICNHKALSYCSKDQATYFKCDFCGTVFQHPLPTLQEMRNYANAEYNNGLYKEYLEANDLKYATFEYRFGKVLEAFVKRNRSGISPRILDIGCSNGRFIEVAVRNGIDAWGLELSENAIAASAAEIRKRIYHGDANTIESLGIEKFNVITAFDLIEHLFDPIGFCNNLHKIVAKNSIVVMTTPDAGSFLRIIMGKHWSMLQPFQHTILLSRKASRILLRETKYFDISVSGTKKVFTFDYLFSQLRGPNPYLYGTYNNIKRIIPHSLRENKVQLNIGEMMIIASLTN